MALGEAAAGACLRSEQMRLHKHRKPSKGAKVGKPSHLRDNLRVEYPVTSWMQSIAVCGILYARATIERL